MLHLFQPTNYDAIIPAYGCSMQLAFSSNAYLNFSIEETIRRVAEIGYQGY